MYPKYDPELEVLRTRQMRRRFIVFFQQALVVSMYLAVAMAWMHLWTATAIWFVQARVLGLCSFYLKQAQRGSRF